MQLVKSSTTWILYSYLINIVICTVLFLNKDLEYNKLRNTKDYLNKLEMDELKVITENSILHKLFDEIDKLKNSDLIQIINRLYDENIDLKDQTYHKISNLIRKLLFQTIVDKKYHSDIKLKTFDDIYYDETNKKIERFFWIDNFLKEHFDAYCYLRNSEYYEKKQIHCKKIEIEDIITTFILRIISLFSKNKKNYNKYFMLGKKIISNLKKIDFHKNTIENIKINFNDSTNEIYLSNLLEKLIGSFEKKYNEQNVLNGNQNNDESIYNKRYSEFFRYLNLKLINDIVIYLDFIVYKNKNYRKFFKEIFKAFKKEIFKPEFYEKNYEFIQLDSLGFYITSFFDFSEIKFLEEFISNFDSCCKKYIGKNMRYRTNSSIEKNSSKENIPSENQQIYIFKNILLSTVFNYIMSQIKINTDEHKKIFDIQNYIKIKKEDKKFIIESFMNEIDCTNIVEKNSKYKNFYFIYEIINVLPIDNNKKIILEDKHKFYEDLRSEIETATQEILLKSIKNNLEIEIQKIYVGRFLMSFFQTISIKKILDKHSFFMCNNIEEELGKETVSCYNFRNFDDFDEKEFFIKSKEICDFLYVKNLFLKEKIQKKHNENFEKWRKEHIPVKKIDETRSTGNDQNFIKKEQEKSVRKENIESKNLENHPSLQEFTSTAIQDSKEKNVSKCSEKIITTKINENERKKPKVKTRSKLPGNLLGNLKQDDCQNKISNDKKPKVQIIDDKQQKNKQPKKSQINSKLIKKKKAQESIENNEFLQLVKITKEHIKSEDKQEIKTMEKKTKEKKTKSKGKTDKLKRSNILRNFLEFKTSKEEDNINSITENIQQPTITKEDYEENYPPIFKEQKNQKKIR